MSHSTKITYSIEGGCRGEHGETNEQISEFDKNLLSTQPERTGKPHPPSSFGNPFKNPAYQGREISPLAQRGRENPESRRKILRDLPTQKEFQRNQLLQRDSECFTTKQVVQRGNMIVKNLLDKYVQEKLAKIIEKQKLKENLSIEAGKCLIRDIAVRKGIEESVVKKLFDENKAYFNNLIELNTTLTNFEREFMKKYYEMENKKKND